MEEEGEVNLQDLICRVCRAHGTPDNQLYHPCKCSGSMKYVHQECLEEWLSHSRKKHCEICNFKYNFTPIYNPNTPQSISLNFFTQIILKKALKTVKFYLRVLLAVFVWLILLPFLSICMWRFWFEPTLLFDPSGNAGTKRVGRNLAINQTIRVILNSSNSAPVLNLANATRETRAPFFAPVLNFTVGYLQHVAKLVGFNNTIWNSVEFPLAQQFGGMLLDEFALNGTAEALLESVEEFDWISAIKKFCTDVFEGQILLSILIIIAIALLCVKEYIVLNTPTDALGNPINLPEGVDAAAFIAAAAAADPPPPQPQGQVRRRARPRPIARPAPQPAVAPAPAVQQQLQQQPRLQVNPPNQQPHPQQPRPTASQPHPTQTQQQHLENLELQLLQTQQQRIFSHALENQAMNGDQVVHLFRRAFDAQKDDSHRHAVANAAHLAVEAAKEKDEELRATIAVYKEECIDKVREAVEDSGLTPGGKEVIMSAFLESVQGAGLSIEEISDLVNSVEKDLKGFRKRRGSVASQVDEAEQQDKLDRITARLARNRKRALEAEKEQQEQREKEASFLEEVAEHQPPGQALNTMRSVEEDLEVIRELGMYMSNKHGVRPVVHRPVIPIRGIVPQGGSSSGAPGGVAESSSSGSVSNGQSSSSSNPSALSTTQKEEEEFEALIKEFEESYAGKGKKRMIDLEAPPEDSRGSQPTHGYSLRNRNSNPQVQQSQPQTQPAAPAVQQPPAPTMPVFSFTAPVGSMPVAPPVPAPNLNDDVDANPAEMNQALRDWLGFPNDNEEEQNEDQQNEERRNEEGRQERHRLQQALDTVARRRELQEQQQQDQLRQAQQQLQQAQQRLQQQQQVRQQQLQQQRQQQREQQEQLQQQLQQIQQQQQAQNDAFNLNVNLELGPDGLAAEVQAQGDLNAFMELVGIQGPIDIFIQNFALALFIVFATLGAGGWVPYMCGRLMLWLFFDVYYGVVNDGLKFGVGILERLTDPVLDPIVDGLVVFVKWSGLVAVSNATASALLNNATVANATVLNDTMIVEAVLSEKPDVSAGLKGVLEQIDSASNNTKIPFESVTVSIGLTGNLTNVTGLTGDKEEEKPQRFEFVSDRVAAIIVGYLTFSFVLYHHARQAGHLRHPYVQTLKRMFYKGFRFLFLALKFSFFITIELGMFPTFCGLLIDLCTLSCFGPGATISSRLLFYRAYPWTSYFLHWLAGTTFMFQFAGYVQSVRKVVRPGVVWFIRDPEDPQFHPMQDILEKPVLTQLRKLSFGAMMYGVVVISTVGGFVGLVHGIQYVFGADQGGPAMFWPVKWEFSEPLSEFPIDLLIFHFLVPAIVSWIKPKELIVYALKVYYRFAARRLRLTNFLFGERMVDEENGEVGEDPYVVKVFEEPEEAGAVDEDVLLDLAADEVEAVHPVEPAQTHDDDFLQRVIPPQPTQLAQTPAVGRTTPYMRVPNHDRIPLKPGTKVMIPMTRDGPLVGRADETEEDIKLNWTRVYVPPHLRLRLLALMLFQWLFGISLAAFLTVGPLYIGRLFFVSLHTYFTNQPLPQMLSPTSNDTSVPEQALNSTSSYFSARRFRFLIPGNSTSLGSIIGRPDLPVHDLFSLSFGLLVFIGVALSSVWLFKCAVAVRDHYRRALRDETNPATAGEKLRSAAVDGVRWAYENALMYFVVTSKALFIGFWVGVAIPTLLGLLFEIYVVVPFLGDKQQTRVFFVLQDWALGAIYTKVIHSIIMNAPDTEFRRVLVQARDHIRQGGIRRFELRPVALKVILPVVLVAVALIFLPPFVFLFMAYLEGDGVPEPGNELNEFLSRLLVPGLMGVFLLYEFIRTTRRSVKRWMDQVRDEHYLVGRRLRNMGEPIVPVATAAAAAMPAVAAVPVVDDVDDAGEVGNDDNEEMPLLLADEDGWEDQDVFQI
ncbi:UNVERIFIED_CONTAM: hypothetical protein HDU68_006865 [Siphonaria sp. JEL0065]|nr:hypothetical protein HDU68_006865 [Siphonaria sp. JEL0065]